MSKEIKDTFNNLKIIADSIRFDESESQAIA